MVASTIFSLLILGGVLWHSGLNFVNPFTYSIDWFFFCVSFALFMINYVFRSVRFCELLVSNVSPYILYGVSLVHGASNYFFPLKLGELSFPLLCKYFLNQSLSESGAALFLCRILDFLFILTLTVIVVFLWAEAYKIFEDLGINQSTYTFFTITVIFFLLLLIFFLAKCSGVFRQIWNKVLDIDRFRPLVFIKMIVLTSLIWFCILGNFYFLSMSLGYDVKPASMVIVSVIMVPLSLMPVQGFANVGTFELAWVSGLIMFGFSQGEALEIAVKVHVLLTVQVALMLAIGGAFLAIRKFGGNHAQ
ncbi:lysylphosphatidylglycerol synthase domain-containing protein [Marinobacter sp. M-5]|uniref:lysylphosphatidylglycerol synthase domain-containing protein n=1 Tax=Marinobacter sp. M-5 TaxID=3081089 RepID=UPI00293CD681|nr:lysylphosphatidylglycerol synthase domain-containing protein [Marinobacter sp. M-5]MDV3503073.1 lysylphosphatidylglycerol synthase domain-containing protein [Marinobacter sp. M-5]